MSKNVFDVGSRFNAYSFPLSDIVIDPELNGRHELPSEEHFEELVASIAERGQLEPGIVRKDGNRVVLSGGFTRYRAIKAINDRQLTPKPLQFLAVYSKGNEVEGFIDGLHENLFRNGLSDIDKGKAIARLRRWQFTDEEIVKKFFPSAGSDKYKANLAKIKRLENLATLSPEAEKAVKNGTVTQGAVAHFATLVSEDQKALLATGSPVTTDTIRQKQGKEKKLTIKQVREELDGLLAEGEVAGVKVPSAVLSWLLSLKNRM